PTFGNLRPRQVTVRVIREYVNGRRAAGVGPATIGLTIRLLSVIMTECMEQRFIDQHPIKAGRLPRNVKKLYKSEHNPNHTPSLERMEQVEAVFRYIRDRSHAVAVAFAIGAFGGLRTGEILGLDWADVDLDHGLLHVRQQVSRGRLA